MYACGVTVYDTCHIGHARSAINFDVITRYLRYRGYRVTYVKNFTDVDDKIIARAQREGVGIAEIAERYIREHDEDMDTLGALAPHAGEPDLLSRARDLAEAVPEVLGGEFDLGALSRL